MHNELLLLESVLNKCACFTLQIKLGRLRQILNSPWVASRRQNKAMTLDFFAIQLHRQITAIGQIFHSPLGFPVKH